MLLIWMYRIKFIDEIQIVSISGIANQSEEKSVGARIPSDVDAFRKDDETLPRQRFNV